jgi:arylsulfatase A-like enzyme
MRANRRETSSGRRPGWRVGRLAPATLCLISLACGGAASPGDTARIAPRSGGPHLLFIVSDTLRADAIDCESARRRTPNLCELADRGVYFENAYAGGPWTLPSSVALFTGNHATSYGQLPPESATDWSERDEFFRIGDDQVLLAEALAAMGYEALRFNEGMLPGAANAFQGLGTQEVEGSEAAKALRQAYPAVRGWNRPPAWNDLGILRYLATREDRSFYLLLWIMDPHAPYSPSAEDVRQVAEGLDDLRYPPSFYAQLGHLDKPENGHYLLRDHAPFSEPELEMLVGLYHAEVRSVDERVGRFLELLRAGGIEEETIVVLTSDHGEGFGEHDRFLHGNSFYEELLRVPLIMAGPGLPAGTRVTARVPGIDVMPTLCDLMDAPCMENIEGRSLLPLIAGELEGTGRPVYIPAPMRKGLRDALIEGDYKLIASSSGIELYDLSRDPGERTNLASELPDVVERMRGTMRELRRLNEERRQHNMASLTDEDRAETTKGTLERMRALGYVD